MLIKDCDFLTTYQKNILIKNGKIETAEQILKMSEEEIYKLWKIKGLGYKTHLIIIDFYEKSKHISLGWSKYR